MAAILEYFNTAVHLTQQNFITSSFEWLSFSMMGHQPD
uniref:Uncharacterized protein n=1 Tax=Arundo donax TaxID=35708 RepID=A0A0A9FKK1_ARUDO